MGLVVTVGATVDKNVTFYITGNGTSGSTTFTDQSFYGATVTPVGTAAVSNDAPTKFYNSTHLTGTGSALVTSSLSAMTGSTYGTSLWFREASGSGTRSLISVGASGGLYNGGLTVLYTGTTISIYPGAGSSVKIFPFTPDTNWHYLAVNVNSTGIEWGLDGTRCWTAVSTTAATAQVYQIGRLDTANDYPFNGYIDDLAFYNQSINVSAIPTNELLYSGAAAPPVSSFTPTGTQLGAGVLSVTFNDTSSGTISDYNWTYQGIAGDNNTVTVFSTAQNPTASFYFGNYSIKHGVNGTAGSNISTQVAWVNVSQFPAPVASFTPVGVTTGISPVSVSFTDTSTNNPTYWNWTIKGYGTNSSTYVNWSTLQNPSASFTTGNFSISLGAGGVGGFNLSTQKTWINVSAYPQIVANFSANTTTPVIPGAAVQFTDSSTPVGLGGLSWLWNFGDGATDTTQNPIHIYTVGGLKTVNLTVFQTLNPSNVNTSIKTNYINVTYNGSYVQAGFTCNPLSGSSGLLVSCTDTSIRGNTTLYGIAYNWSFGDAGLSASPFSSTVGSVTHVYPSVGTFTVILKVNNTINSDTMTRENYITISTAQQNTWYSPKQIALTVMSFTTSDRVVSAPITLQAVGSSLQDIGQLQTIYGVNPTAANQMANGTLIMSSSTGSDGTAMFTVLASIRYIANVTDPSTGILYSVPINPGLDPYNVWIGSNPINNLTSEQIAMNGTRLFLTQADPGNVTLNLNYQDISGATTDVHFTVVAALNMTTILDQDLGNPGTGVVIANWTHGNVRGNGYYWYYNATRTV